MSFSRQELQQKPPRSLVKKMQLNETIVLDCTPISQPCPILLYCGGVPILGLESLKVSSQVQAQAKEQARQQSLVAALTIR
jgi:hypothetical protein